MGGSEYNKNIFYEILKELVKIFLKDNLRNMCISVYIWITHIYMTYMYVYIYMYMTKWKAKEEGYVGRGKDLKGGEGNKRR